MAFNQNSSQPGPSNKHSKLSRFGSATILILFAIFYFGMVLLVLLIGFLFTGEIRGSFWDFNLPFVLAPFVVCILVTVGLCRGKKWAFVMGALIAIGISYKPFYPIGTIAGLLLIFFIYWADRRSEEKIERYAFTILFIALATFTIITKIGEQSLPNFNPDGKKIIGMYDPEIRYWLTARELKSHEACYLIDPESFVDDLDAPNGEQMYFLRSRCIVDIALITKDPSLCNQAVSAGKVKTSSGTVRDGTGISADECGKVIASGGQLYVPGSLSNFKMNEEWEFYMELLKRLGYTEQDVSNFFGNNKISLTDWKTFYDKVKDTPEFKSRLNNIQK